MNDEFISLTILCSKIHTKMCEIHDKTTKSCYISYKNDLYNLLKKMDTSIESFNKKELRMNTGNTYYFIDDFNKICKCENGMKSDESIVLETYELVDDVNRLVEENEQLKKRLELYREIYPTGKWITKLTSEELKKELEE